MCVIIIKKKGVRMPSENELRLAATHNPHGFGFVSSNGLYVRTMDFEEFYQALKGVGREDACIIHFRIATHGSVRVSNCHPFKMHGIYFAHNGILPTHPRGDMTDSETEFRDVLCPAAEFYGLGTKEFADLVARRIYYSKFAFMKDGEVYTYGKFVTDRHGVMWSNMNHRPYLNWGSPYCKEGRAYMPTVITR